MSLKSPGCRVCLMWSNKLVERFGLLQGEERYLPVSLSRLWAQGTTKEKAVILGGWLLSVIASVIWGLIVVTQGWSGMPVPFGGVEVFITTYPPFLICLWWTISFGWVWGAIPAYLATFILAVYSGMPLAWALLFGFANPLGFAAVAIGYRAIGVTRDLHTIPSFTFYVLITFVGAIFSSSGALIWSYTNQVDTLGVLPIWQGWWLGGFLQSVLIVGPLLYFIHPLMARWQQQRTQLRVDEPEHQGRQVLKLVLVMVAGVLLYGFMTIKLGVERLSSTLDGLPDPVVVDAVDVMTSTVWIFFCVFALIFLSVGAFNYRLFTRWETMTTGLVSELSRLAQTDYLTALYNRRAMTEVLEKQFSRVQRYDEAAALMMVDIDHFKAINDAYGHTVGDEVIRHFADLIRQSVRAGDVAARWGGEEFLILLPHVDQAGAGALAERLCQQVQEQPAISGGEPIRYTVSVGVAYLARERRKTLDEWIRCSDQALYSAKQQGRNQVVVL